MKPDAMAELIPWYANGTLADRERRDLEEHLSTCADCRDLLAQATAFVAASAQVTDLEGHVEAEFLTRFVEDRHSLEREAADSIAAHLERCRLCRSAAAAVAKVVVTEPAPSEAPRVSRRMWHLLRRTALHPVAALVYLAILAIVPLERRFFPGRPQEVPASVHDPARVLPPRIEIPGEDVLRGLPETQTPIELPANASEVLLELETDIDREDLENPATSFVIELSTGTRVVWSERRSGAALAGERGRPLVLVSADHFSKGVTYTLRIRLVRPGAPEDRQVVFQRSIRIPGP